MLAKFSFNRLPRKSLTTVALLLVGSASWAGGVAPGGSVDYAPLTSSVSAVPTLGEWMLVLMALLVAVVAYRGLRGRVNGRLLSNLTLVAGALAAAAAGHGLVQEAKAIVADLENMSSPTGGTVMASYWTQLTNTAGVPLKIIAIRPNPGSVVNSPPPDSPECTVGYVVSPTGKCNIEFIPDGEEGPPGELPV